MGSKLEVKSNCPEFETFIITTTGALLTTSSSSSGWERPCSSPRPMSPPPPSPPPSTPSSTCFNKRQGHMKVVVDRVNKNAFMNKFSVESTVHKDDRMALEMSVNTMVTPYTFHMIAPYFLPRFFNDINRKTIDAAIMHEMGSKLEVKSNCPEFETFIITTTG